MTMIKAPFNFVPLADKVYHPEWANKISMDIPFRDGVSGTIDITFKAETPIFVRNGHKLSDEDNSFSHISKDGHNCYFIPGSSIKGEIRQVLKILSFGKITVDPSSRFAQREWYNSKLYTLKSKQGDIHCGWLKYDDDTKQYIIVDCGTPYRIGLDEVDKFFERKKGLLDLFKINPPTQKRPRINLNQKIKIDSKEYDPKTAVYKYKRLGKELIDKKICRFQGSLLDSKNQNSFNTRVKHDINGNIKGTIVLTGQVGPCKFPRCKGDTQAGKFYEFVFSNPENQSNHYTLDDFDQYRFIYQDSEDWKYYTSEEYQQAIGHKGMPVFFRIKEGKIYDFGLSYLYKLPYRNRVEKTLTTKQKAGLDLADCIFGYSQGENALKGRVQFSIGEVTKWVGKEEEIPLILNNPKASYYPIYIHQERKPGTDELVGEYKTYNDGMIAGWKRYYVRNGTWKNEDSPNENIKSKITPLSQDTEFKCTVHFHNLKEVELGALLSAITFHGNTDHCFHLLGGAKPYGYGKVKVIACELKANPLLVNEEEKDAKFYMQVFEKEMNNFSNDWLKSESIKELLALSSCPVTRNEQFDYMELGNFVEVKSGRDNSPKYALQPYLELINFPDWLRTAYEERQNQAGLSFLQRTNEEGRFRINSFKDAQSKISTWLRNNGKEQLDEPNISQLRDFLLRLYRDYNEKDLDTNQKRAKKKLENLESAYWKTIEVWTNSDIAQELFKQCIKK